MLHSNQRIDGQSADLDYAFAKYKLFAVHLSLVQDQAIQARTAMVVGAKTYDRLFSGIRFDELDCDLLYVYAADEEKAAEIEDNFSLHVAIIATTILKTNVEIVLVLPKVLQ